MGIILSDNWHHSSRRIYRVRRYSSLSWLEVHELQFNTSQLSLHLCIPYLNKDVADGFLRLADTRHTRSLQVLLVKVKKKITYKVYFFLVVFSAILKLTYHAGPSGRAV
jgi:hypothetical protein